MLSIQVETINPTKNQKCCQEYLVEENLFPAKELNYRIPREFIRGFENNGLHSDYSKIDTVTIKLQYCGSDDLIGLSLLKGALDYYKIYSDFNINLFIPYFPYARQDRRCNEGEAHSLKIIANLINSLEFDMVTIADPHSDVVEALVDNINIITQDKIIMNSQLISLIGKVIISPDGGSLKKCQKIIKRIKKLYSLLPITPINAELVECSKIRDLETGKILSNQVHGDVNGKDCIIIDDIGDGMGTFIPLAKQLRESGAKTVELYVTHGIFSKGLTFLEYFDKVYTTDSYDFLNSRELDKENKISVLKL